MEDEECKSFAYIIQISFMEDEECKSLAYIIQISCERHIQNELFHFHDAKSAWFYLGSRYGRISSEVYASSRQGRFGFGRRILNYLLLVMHYDTVQFSWVYFISVWAGGNKMKATSAAFVVIVPEVLNHDNYDRWSVFMENYLIGKGLWDVVISERDYDIEQGSYLI
ncbi:hypothetical protein QL285_074824 [Trifolium repens]|nr:hypothetical protein QL285_074824 [Trifolium repens]